MLSNLSLHPTFASRLRRLPLTGEIQRRYGLFLSSGQASLSGDPVSTEDAEAGVGTRRSSVLLRRLIMLIFVGWLPTVHEYVAGLPAL
jgi:hypothetical protein